MTCYLLCKHPRHPYYTCNGPTHLEAFTIAGVYKTREEAAAVARDKNKLSSYLYTVKRFTGVKE